MRGAKSIIKVNNKAKYILKPDPLNFMFQEFYLNNTTQIFVLIHDSEVHVWGNTVEIHLNMQKRTRIRLKYRLVVAGEGDKHMVEYEHFNRERAVQYVE